jgi:cis-L-3-hydroxyproline dehydratase
MKISQIDVYQVDLPYAGGVYLLSGGREYRSFEATIVRYWIRLRVMHLPNS